ncbi:preprotein translocase subunit YajC [Lactococcus garvieae]|jgi:preprotein translocase subunit YajC|uniref:Preprotein translocase subunit YajC n=1 Tax=Lactococcus garvieae DCC43 TaxID=1231377 RepID=K2NUF6_9LACT|nr:preprotein translocase subunit YajC [Lactococcus garvieae]EKF51143.1 Preprotein translocase subunit YajC [Lactococcus garvieae DCC43]QPS70706.1 preprotein translocase subunit YajC [Lactococcus garvieae]
MNMMSLILMVVVVGGMMFFMNRSQKKAQQQRQEQLNSMVIGADIVTIGGLHGTLSAVNEADATIELDCEGVILTFDRAAVKTVKNNTVVAPTVSETPVVEETKTEDNPIEE